MVRRKRRGQRPASPAWRINLATGVEFAHSPEFGLDAGSAIGLPPLGVDGGDLRSEPNIGPGPLRLRLVMPLVVGGAGDR